jgi:hypothetical protein
MKKIIKFLILLLLLIASSTLHAIAEDELLQIHRVTTTKMNNINTPQAGSLVYNTTENTLFFYTGTTWKRLHPNGSETILNADSGIVISGNGTVSAPYTIGVN